MPFSMLDRPRGQESNFHSRIMEMYNAFYEAGKDLTILATVSKKGRPETYYVCKAGSIIKVEAK